MNDQPRLLKIMQSTEIKFSKSDRRLAEIVLRDPHHAIHLSIACLAEEASVSEPTVSRFCMKLGCGGYPEFKVRLAQEISSGDDLIIKKMDRGDNTTQVMHKITDNILASVQAISRSTSAQSIDLAADLLAKSRTLYFFGLGASGPVALDAEHKFCRFGIRAVAHTDSINQRMICSMLDSSDAVVVISYTGQTRILLENMKIARGTGAPIIGLTRNGTPLAGQCDVVLNAVTAEDVDLYTPMTSRVIHLAILDMLATTVALRLGDEVESRIERIQQNLRDTRVDNNEDEGEARTPFAKGWVDAP